MLLWFLCGVTHLVPIFTQKAANLSFVVVLLSIAGYIVNLVLSKTRTWALFPAIMHRAKVEAPQILKKNWCWFAMWKEVVMVEGVTMSPLLQLHLLAQTC